MGKYWIEQRRVARRSEEANALSQKLARLVRDRRLHDALEVAVMLEQLQPGELRWSSARAELLQQLAPVSAARPVTFSEAAAA